jgi:hypothetical protein
MSDTILLYVAEKTSKKESSRNKYRIFNCAIGYHEGFSEKTHFYQHKLKSRNSSDMFHPIFTLHQTAFPTQLQAHNAWNDIVFGEKNEIQLAIEEAKVLLTFQENWDENGALPTEKGTFKFASTFLSRIHNALANIDFILEVPFIDITNKGGISLKWENERAQFYIIFNNENANFAYYYGESKNEEKPDKIKSGIDLNTGQVDNFLLDWFKLYLCNYGTRS